MKIKWLGHSCFLVTSKAGLKIITDPYTPGGIVRYAKIKESADVVTVSHEHGDHNALSFVSGKPEVVRIAGLKDIKGIKVNGISCFHDDISGRQRGANIVFCFKVDDIIICHLGDLGHRLSTAQIDDIGKVDLLMIPVGGNYTIDAKVATLVCNDLKPKVIFPMHYKTPRIDYPISGVDVFLKNKKNVRRLDSSEVEIRKETLPKETEIVVLQSEY